MWTTWLTFPKMKEKNNKCWKMMIFDHFEGWVNFGVFWPTTPNFQKYAPERRNFCRPQNSGDKDFRCLKTFPNRCAYFFWHILSVRQFYRKFQEKFLVIFGPLEALYRAIGAFWGVGEVGQLQKNNFLVMPQNHPKYHGNPYISLRDR